MGLLRMSMRDLESGGVSSDEDENRGISHSSNTNKGGSKRKLDKLRSGSLNIYGRIDKDEKGKDVNGKSSNRPPKPPKAPRGPALDDADMKFIREISEVSKVKHARIQRLRSIRNKRVVVDKPPAASSTNIVAMVVTVVFFIIIVFQGIRDVWCFRACSVFVHCLCRVCLGILVCLRFSCNNAPPEILFLNALQIKDFCIVRPHRSHEDTSATKLWGGFWMYEAQQSTALLRTWIEQLSEKDSSLKLLDISHGTASVDQRCWHCIYGVAAALTDERSFLVTDV
ncbi:hypothetical protein LINPERHAP1_LOCUS16603 [Linum perenne]